MTLLQIPTLETARLRLEPLSAAHSSGMFALWSRPEVCRHSGPAIDADGLPINLPATSPGESDRIIAFFVRRAAAGLGLRWALMTRSDDGADSCLNTYSNQFLFSEVDETNLWCDPDRYRTLLGLLAGI